MACSSSLLMFKLGNAESRNPLECLICDREFTEPIRLPCQHSYCHDCVQGRSSCPVCGNAIEGELVADPLLTFLIETSHEAADVCANCDQISQPMHFCETCQQALCNRCRQNTHQAKMFAAHRLVPLEERARIKGRATCPLHGEPYILYSVENRSLACIICFNNAALDSSLRQTCQEMIDTLLSVRDRLFKKLDEEKALREKHFHEQMRQLTSLQPLIRLYLLSASIFCSSASKLDFLQSSTDLMKRIQNLISMECDKPLYTGELTIDSREEFSRALEPFLGLSSILLSTGRNRGDETSDRSCGTSSPRGHHAYIKRSGSIYMNGSSPLSTKYQLVVDLAGAFGEQFARVETPLRQYNRGVAKLGKSVQEMQKDLTLRRCIIRKEFPQLQQIWQEQLDRVRRQQVLFREKIEEMIQLRENARHVLSAARQLEPFAVCLAAVSSVIDRRRCHRPDPAPMESLCLQINTIEPDSQHRIEAIEKEEQNRRLAQDQKKREEQLKFASAKKQLKTTKEQKMLTRDSARNSAAKQRMVNTTRDRSRGGTDRTLLSPCNRRHKGLSMGSRSSKSQSDPEDIESSMDDSFEFIAESASAEVETTKFECEHTLCRSQPLRLSAPLPVLSKQEEPARRASSSLPDDEQLSKRISDIHLSTAAKCQPCQDQKSGAPTIPRVPFIPTTIFAGISNAPSTLGAWEVREKLFESIKQKVPRVDVGATKTPEREIVNAKD
ncbi:unnamed protein product [Toxocara canis]|uniref:RING finger protein 207 n=1 Tax=Toxocara canis TaxID=6265 RepID=A0A183ULA7_TOXCA|nr:unnamed protein product [Toxocara canis]